MSLLNIVIPGDYPPQIAGSLQLNRLSNYGEVILHADLPRNTDEQIDRVLNADIIINTRGSVKWDREKLSRLPKLKMISTCSIGTDMIDLKYARQSGIIVSNQPGRTSYVVAEHIFGLMFALAKQAALQTAHVKSGKWIRLENILLTGKTLGIVGTGNIGTNMAKLGKAIGMKVIAWTFNPSKTLVAELGVQYVEFDELLEQSDVISLHVNLSEKTKKLIDTKEISKMKDGSLLINGGRGGLINTKALIEALNSKKLGGAGLDVFDQEPIDKDHPLLRCENVVFTPHMADQTPEGIELLNEGAVDNVVAYLEGKPINVC